MHRGQLQVGSGRAPRGASSHSRPGSFCIKAFLFPLSVFSCHFLSLSPGRAAGEGYERSATEEAGSSSSFSISEAASMLPGPVWGCSWAPALAAPQPSLGPGGGRCPWNPLAGSPCHAAGLWHHLAPGLHLNAPCGASAALHILSAPCRPPAPAVLSAALRGPGCATGMGCSVRHCVPGCHLAPRAHIAVLRVGSDEMQGHVLPLPLPLLIPLVLHTRCPLCRAHRTDSGPP